MNKDSAFSGLEAAIVLIAFVVVAAVFSYVMLGAGFFATQKSQEVTYSGIKQSTSNIVLDGQVYGHMVGNLATGNLDTLTIYLTIPEGGQPQKLSELAFILTVNNVIAANQPATKTFTNPSDGATVDVLQPGNRVKAVLDITGSAGPTAGGSFTLEIKPKVGASTLISKILATGYNGGVIL